MHELGLCRAFALFLRSWFETRSLPALARSSPRRFTFYFGNPFPQFLVPN
jgi:hypothetical protein